MSLLSFLGDIFKPAVNLIDDLHTSEEEKLKLRNELSKMQFEFQSKVLEYETKLMESKAKIISSEAGSQHFITSAWRPIVMLTFTAIIVARWFGFTDPGLPSGLEEKLFNIVQLGIGGYIVGRSGEKIAKVLKQ